MIRAKHRAARPARDIEKRVAAFCRGDKQHCSPGIVPLNRGFFQLERMRARQKARKQKAQG